MNTGETEYESAEYEPTVIYEPGAIEALAHACGVELVRVEKDGRLIGYDVKEGKVMTDTEQKAQRLVAQFSDVHQYGPEDFEPPTRTLLIDERTTVGELLAWWRRTHVVGKDVSFRGPIRIMECEQECEF